MTRVFHLTSLMLLLVCSGCGMFGKSKKTSTGFDLADVQIVDVVSSGKVVYRTVNVTPLPPSEARKKTPEQPQTSYRKTPEQPQTSPTKSPGQSSLTSSPALPEQAITASEYKRAEAGDADAQFNLALQLEADGKLEEAVSWYQRAADQNQAEAQYNLGYAYLEGNYLPESYVNAEIWFLSAAKQGLAIAQHMMGFLYAEGRPGVPKNFEKSTHWYRKAAGQDFASAQAELGYIYAEGNNPTEASYWFLKAAENHIIDAQFQIGIRLARGDGVEQNVVDGYMWLLIACDGNHEGAQTVRDKLKLQMNFAQITEAQTRSGKYIAKIPQK